MIPCYLGRVTILISTLMVQITICGVMRVENTHFATLAGSWHSGLLHISLAEGAVPSASVETFVAEE